MFVVQRRKDGYYHGYCHTTGESMFINDINNPMVEKYDTMQHLKGDMNWVPWHWWLTKYKIIKI